MTTTVRCQSSKPLCLIENDAGFLFQGMAVLRMLRGFLEWDSFQSGLKVS